MGQADVAGDAGAHALLAFLGAAVPLWIADARAWPEDERARRRAACAQAVAEHGDMILYRGGRRGETAEAANRLAEGIALLAFAPGGVRIFGRHWQAA